MKWLLLCVAAAACSSNKSSSGVSVSISPASASLQTGQQQQFSATVSGNSDTSVAWSVEESSGGSVSDGGVYTAPNSGGTYHVVATSSADASASATATCTVTQAAITTTIGPKAAQLAPGGLQPFSCTVSGTTDGACTWSITEGAAGGTISATGLYSAPATAGTYHVVATSHANGATDTATITVASGAHSCPAGFGSGQIGQWVDVTPPGLDLTAGDFSDSNYGMQEVVVDPTDPATVYLSTCYQGFFRSTDCGQTWTKMNTGANASIWSGGRAWALDIDPVNTQTLYTTMGYGVGSIWQTTNGGVDWNNILPPSVTAGVNAFGGLVDIYDIKVDPYDHNHIIAVFHSWWTGAAGHNNADAGVLEGRFDGSNWSWTLHNPAAGMAYSQIVFFLGNSNTWLIVGDDGPIGTWLTTDGGASFNKVSTNYHQHGGCQIYRSGDTYYVCGTPGVWRSTDGGGSWSSVTSALSWTMGLVGDGTNLYAMSALAAQNISSPTSDQTISASESSGTSWSLVGTQKQGNGAKRMAADRIHHIIYAADWGNGAFRMVTQ